MAELKGLVAISAESSVKTLKVHLLGSSIIIGRTKAAVHNHVRRITDQSTPKPTSTKNEVKPTPSPKPLGNKVTKMSSSKHVPSAITPKLRPPLASPATFNLSGFMRPNTGGVSSSSSMPRKKQTARKSVPGSSRDEDLNVKYPPPERGEPPSKKKAWHPQSHEPSRDNTPKEDPWDVRGVWDIECPALFEQWDCGHMELTMYLDDESGKHQM